MKFVGLLLSNRYISSDKRLYTEDLPNITFNYLGENSPNDLCHFRNRSSCFMTQLLFICLTLRKVTNQSANFQTFHWSR